MRVLHVGLSINPGGVESFVLNYHRNIDKDGIQFDYLDIYGDGIAFSDEIYQLGGKIFTLPNYKKHPFRAMKKMQEVLRNNDFEIMHIHMQSVANIMPIMVGLKNKNIKVICHSHSSATPKGILRKILNWICKKRIKKFNVHKWACGKKAGEWMWGDSFSSEDVIPNAIDYDFYKKDDTVRNRTRQVLGIENDDKVIGFVGRFGEEKNTFFLIDILKELLKISPKYKLLTVGGNGIYNNFIKKLEEEKLQEHYYSAGIQKTAAEWYQAMDAFLLPSFFEGFPMVGVEAQAVGIPCFLSDRIDQEINITDTVRFLPIETDDAIKWAKAIDASLLSQKISYDFPDKYKIKSAYKYLEEKYESLVK